MMIDVIFDSTICYDASFFQNLDLDQLKSLGIDKGQAIQPRPANHDITRRSGTRGGLS